MKRVNGAMAVWEGQHVYLASGRNNTAVQSEYCGDMYVRIHCRVRSRASNVTKDVRLASLDIVRVYGIGRQGSFRLDAWLALHNIRVHDTRHCFRRQRRGRKDKWSELLRGRLAEDFVCHGKEFRGAKGFSVHVGSV